MYIETRENHGVLYSREFEAWFWKVCPVQYLPMILQKFDIILYTVVNIPHTMPLNTNIS